MLRNVIYKEESLQVISKISFPLRYATKQAKPKSQPGSQNILRPPKIRLSNITI